MTSTYVSALPGLAVVRVLTSGGPYRPGDELSLAFHGEGVGRLVAHDAAVRAACIPFRCAVPEIIAALVVHGADAYAAGDVLTLSFVDPGLARIYVSAERRRSGAAAPSDGANEAAARAALSPQSPGDAPNPLVPRRDDTSAVGAAPSDGAEADRPILITSAARTGEFDVAPSGLPLEAKRGSVAAIERRLSDKTDLIGSVPSPAETIIDNAQRSAAPGAKAALDTKPVQPATAEAERDACGAAERHAPEAATSHESEAGAGAATSSSDRTEPGPSGTGVIVRLDWSQERLRRFVGVVDKMFTIDRLGWYRHALAMRLLIPDRIECGHPEGDLQANLHLQALRSAAVAALGNPLLAACMPNFTVTSAWLETLEGGAEARAIAGLRDALLPYVEDASSVPAFDSATAQTAGAIGRRELLDQGALSVDAFIPLLIPTQSRDAALSRCLHDYRRLLIDLFGQTARSAESVRINAMAQPNYSLDDHLWQLAGAVGEAFGSRAYAT